MTIELGAWIGGQAVAVHVPLAGMITAITGRLEQLGQRARPHRQQAFRRVHVDLLGITTG